MWIKRYCGHEETILCIVRKFLCYYMKRWKGLCRGYKCGSVWLLRAHEPLKGFHDIWYESRHFIKATRKCPCLRTSAESNSAIGMYSYHSLAKHSPWRWRRYIPPKRHFTQDLHGATSYPEDGGDMFLRNVTSHKIYTAPRPRRRQSSWCYINHKDEPRKLEQVTLSILY
jgi:hypothetical protein